MKKMLLKLWKEYKSLLVFISLLLVFRSAVADWNDVPTGSMKPTIVEGDRIFINKMAYDIRVPFTHISLVKLAEPQPNDIIIFDSVASDKRLVKRVIGVPGDKISMRNNQLFINGQAIAYEAKEKSIAKKSTHERTKEFIEQGLSIEEIADTRGLAPNSIIEHILAISKKFPEVDVSRFRPEGKIITKVKKAYDQVKKDQESDALDTSFVSLKLVFEGLKKQVSYNNIKLAMIFF